MSSDFMGMKAITSSIIWGYLLPSLPRKNGRKILSERIKQFPEYP
jgi:hypothetical protein